MIRDPSDGTVREDGSKLSTPRHHPKPLETKPYGAENTVLDIASSGPPLESQKPEAQAKLEKSRAWLKDYFHRKPEQGV